MARGTKRVYRKVACYKTKTAAKAAAKKMRKAGKTARVSGLCVLSAGKRK